MRKLLFLSLLIPVYLFGQGITSPLSKVWAVDDGEYISWKKRHSPARDNDSNATWKRGVGGVDTLHMFGAGNEIVSSQLVLEGGAVTARNINVKLQYLIKGTDTIQSRSTDATQYKDRNIELFREHFLWLPDTCRTSVETYQAGGNGSGTWDNGLMKPDSMFSGLWIPEQLIPLEAQRDSFPNGTDTLQGGAGGLTGPGFMVFKDCNEVIWIDVFIPKNQAFGVYRGNIIIWNPITGDTYHTIPVRLDVYNFNLSDTTHLPNIWGTGYDQFKRQMGVADFSPNYWGWTDRLHKLMHRHRMGVATGDEPYDTLKTRLMGYYSGTKFVSSNGYEGPGVGRGHEMYYIGMYIHGNNGNYPGYFNVPGLGPWSDTESGWHSMTDAFATLFSDSATHVQYGFYTIDEPYRRNEDGGTQMEAIDTRSSWIRSGTGSGKNVHLIGDPGWFDVTSLNYTPATNYRSSITWWVMGVGPGGPFWYFHTERDTDIVAPYYNGEEVHGQVLLNNVASGRVGVYNSYGGGFTKLEHLDWPLVHTRIAPWIIWDFRDVVTDYFMWDITFWAEANWNPWKKLGYPSDKGVGYGSFVYYGRDSLYGEDRHINMPIAGIRLKAFRRGLQDYEYLWTANQRSVYDTLWVDSSSVATGFDDFRTFDKYSNKPNEPLPYHRRGWKVEAVRRKMADALGTYGGTPVSYQSQGKLLLRP